MDAAPLSLIIIVCLVIGLLAGWLAGSARATARAAERESELYRDFADQTRADDQTRSERDNREQTVLRALAPVQETLRSVQRTVSELERDRYEQFGSVAEQLRLSNQAGEALRATTESLAGALRSHATRGFWGEAQLRRVVEASGLLHHVDFDLQTTIDSDVGRGRPDMVVRLPGGASLAVDAKVPLETYLDAAAIDPTASGERGDQRRALLAAHAKSLRAHIDALARREYWRGLPDSPEFVICFLPSEALLSAALDQDAGLLDYAFGRKVALATPVNLWAVLKTVSHAWSQQSVSEEARELLRLGTELYSRLGSLAGHADELRRAIERTVDGYNKLVGSLESRVLVSARRFPGLDDAKRDALSAPKTIDSSLRPLTAPEMLADVGELRSRLEP